ncbi:protein kinase [Eubacteriaceae bacterium ES3]|nr:protein kinase [Eubacteriaceae bacterium ES3]
MEKWKKAISMRHLCQLMKLNGNGVTGILAYYGYENLSIIGTGRFGKCYKVRNNNHDYCLKIYKQNEVKRRKQKVLHEGRLLKQLNHAGIPRFVEMFERDGILGLVMEKKSGICLSDIEEKGLNLSSKQVNCITETLIDLLTYLECENVRHRDIQLANLIWDAERLFLIDFGSARKIKGHSIYFETDFWALGDVIIRLLSCCDVFFSPKNDAFYNLNIPESSIQFIKRLLYIEKPFQSFKEIKICYRNTWNR